MTRPRRRLRRAALALLAVAMAGAMALGALVSTEAGLRTVVRLVERALSPTITVESVTGRLAGPLQVRGLFYASSALRVGIREVEIDWTLRALLRRVLDVRSLEANGVEIEVLPAPPGQTEKPPRGMPPSTSLPIGIRVTEATIRTVSIRGVAESFPHTVDSLSIEEVSYRTEASVGSLRLWSPEATLRLAGTVLTSGRYPLEIEAAGTLRPPEPYAEIDLSVAASGDLEALGVRLSVQRPLEAELTGAVDDPLAAPRVDAELTVEQTDFRTVIAEGPEGRAGGSLRFAGPIDSLGVRGGGTLSLPSTGAIDVEVGLTRRPERVLFEHLRARSGPTRVEATGELGFSGETPTLDARIGWVNARWPLRGEPTAASAGGSAVVAGDMQDYRTRIEAEVALPATPAVDGAMVLVGTGDDASLTLDTLRLDVLEGTLFVLGRASWRDDVRWQLDLRGDGLQPGLLAADTTLHDARVDLEGNLTGAFATDRLTGSLRLDTLTGTVRGAPLGAALSATVAGSAPAWEMRIDGSVARLDRPDLEGAFAFLGTGTPDSVQIDSLDIEVQDGALSVTGSVAWAPDLRWQLDARGSDVPLGPVLPDTTLRDTRLSFVASTGGRRAPDTLVTRIMLDSLSGQARGEPFTGHADAAVDLPFGPEGPRIAEARVLVDEMEATWRQSRLELSGAIEDSVDLTLRLAVPDLSLLRPGATGGVALDLHALGPRAQPEAELTATAHDVVLGDAPEAPPLFDSLSVTASGAPAAHEGSVWLIRRGGSAELGAEGSYADREWSGRIDRLDLFDPRLGEWRLEDPARLALAPDSAALDRACLTQQPGRACASGVWRTTAASEAAVQLEGISGRRLTEMLPPNWAIDGRLGGRASGTLGQDGSLRGEAVVDLGSGTIDLGTGGTGARLRYSDVGLEATVDESGARLSLATELFDEAGASAMRATAEVSLAGYDNANTPLGGQELTGFVRSSVPDLSLFRHVIPGLEPVGGEVDIDLTLGGTVANSEVEGEARVHEASVDVPGAGLELREIEVVARGRGGEGIELDAALRSGTGRLTIRGQSPVGPTASQPARLHVAGTRVRALGLPSASVWASPDLEVALSPDGVRTTGEVEIPVARIELTEMPATAVRASEDVVFVDDTTGIAFSRALEYAVRLTLGDSITFRGFGFSAEPGGVLALRNGPGGTVEVTGDITLEEGRYRAYGQDLTMERGRLLFAGGAPDNPGLDIRASRTASDGTVAGLEVRGTLQDPEVTIFSDPPMTETEALSYIVLGRPMNANSTSDGNRVRDAALALGVQRSNEIASRLGRTLGLEEMTVEAGETLKETSIVAGRHLAPDLYVSYGVGLFEPVSVFRIRYMLSRRWTLRAESGKANSADLLFRFERGR